MAIKAIKTNGYRGPGTKFAYMPPGEYTAGSVLDIVGGVIPQKLADYLVEIGNAEVVETAELIAADLAPVGQSPEMDHSPSDEADQPAPKSRKRTTTRRKTTAQKDE